MSELLAEFFAPVVLFGLGFTAGFVVALWAGGLPHDSIQRAIALLITLIWLLSVVSSITVAEYTTPLAIHGIMGAVAGFLFTGEEGVRLPTVPRGGSGGNGGGGGGGRG